MYIDFSEPLDLIREVRKDVESNKPSSSARVKIENRTLCLTLPNRAGDVLRYSYSSKGTPESAWSYWQAETRAFLEHEFKNLGIEVRDGYYNLIGETNDNRASHRI